MSIYSLFPTIISNQKLMPPNRSTSPVSHQNKLNAFNRLLHTIDELRKNCEWFKNQTWESLRNLTIEETYELSDSILNNETEEVKNELGDLMLHIAFYALMAEEKKKFDMTDILDSISKKLIERNPHIYGKTKNSDSAIEITNWEERKLNSGNSSVLQGIPKTMPALIKAMRIQEKASGIGFEWKNKEDVWEKVEEEILEFKRECNSKNIDNQYNLKATEEFGDILFSLVNFARFINIDPEVALERTNKKFITRFQYIETTAVKDGKKMGSLTLSEMDKYWEEAKKKKNH